MTTLLDIFRKQENPKFPIDFNGQLNPIYPISFKKVGEMKISPLYPILARDFFLGNSVRKLSDYFSIIDEPIKQTIKTEQKQIFSLTTKERIYNLYRSSPGQKTSDITRYLYDMVRISSMREILAIVGTLTEYESLYHSIFVEQKRKSRNIDIGYAFLRDEKGERDLYVIFIEVYPGERGHLHCTKVPRMYKPNRYFMVPKSDNDLVL